MKRGQIKLDYHRGEPSHPPEVRTVRGPLVVLGMVAVVLVMMVLMVLVLLTL